ncbi:MAG: hypothetical protein IPL98_11200 [Saprospiraceae bacterium]|nr:hypothetical protein [Saprospiraceae bacterium]
MQLGNKLDFDPNSGTYSIRNLKGGQSYVLYLSCGSCCSKIEFTVPYETNPISLVEACDGEARLLSIKGYDDCRIIWYKYNPWPLIVGTGKRIFITEEGDYTARILCPDGSRFEYIKEIKFKPKIDLVRRFCYESPLTKMPYLYIEVNANPDVPGSIYKWSNGNSEKAISTSISNAPIEVSVTDPNGCTTKRSFLTECCNSTKCGQVLSKGNSIGNLKNGYINVNCKDCDYLWTGPNGFQSTNCSLNNLENGDYRCIMIPYSLPCQQPFIVSLRNCQEVKYNLSYTHTPYCDVYTEIELEITISGLYIAPPYKLEITNGTLISKNKAGDYFKFKGLGDALAKASYTLTDNAGCVQKGEFDNIKSSYSVNKIIDENSIPPKCYIEKKCGGNIIGTVNIATSEEYNENNCVIVSICEGKRMYNLGKPVTTVFHNKETNECWQFSVCEFIIGNKKENRAKGDIVKVECPPDVPGGTKINLSINDIKEVIQRYWPQWLKDGCVEAGCGEIVSDFDNTTNKQIIRFEPFACQRFYCYTEDGECLERYECGYYKIGTKDWVKKWLIDEHIVPVSQCEKVEKIGLCASKFKSDCTDKLIKSSDGSGFITVSENEGQYSVVKLNNDGIRIEETNIPIFYRNITTGKFEVKKIIENTQGYSIFVNANFVDSIQGSAIEGSAEGQIIKLDYDISGNLMYSSNILNESKGILQEVMIDPNGNYTIIFIGDPDIVAINTNESSSMYIASYNQNNTRNWIQKIPNFGNSSSSKITFSSVGDVGVITLDSSKIENLTFQQYTSNGLLEYSHSIHVDGMINSLDLIPIGSQMRILINNSSTNEYNSSIYSITATEGLKQVFALNSSQELNIIKLLPDNNGNGYLLVGDYKDSLQLPNGAILQSNVSDIFLLKLDNTDQIVYSVSSAGTNLVHIKDVVQLADGSIMMLANFYGTGIEFEGKTYTGKVDICNNALIPYSSTLPIQNKLKIDCQ